MAVHQYPPFSFDHGLVLLGSVQESLSENDRQRPSRSRDEALLKLRENTVKAYDKLYKNLILSRGEEEADYNLVGCEHFLMMVPRKKEKAFNDLSVNALGRLLAMQDSWALCCLRTRICCESTSMRIGRATRYWRISHFPRKSECLTIFIMSISLQ